MKRFWITFTVMLLLAAFIFLVDCGMTPSQESQGEPTPTEPTEPTSTVAPSFDIANVPENLIAMWRSADAGELDMIETITFEPDGSISVNCLYQGADVGTIYGTYYVTGNRIHCDMTSNGQPYIVEYQFILDGRELTLQDDDGPAHYLRVS